MRYAILALLLFVFADVRADAASEALPSNAALSNAAQALLSALEAIHTMQGTFVQQGRDRQGTVLQTQRGHFAVARNGEFLWEIEKPYAQKILSDGSNVRLYDPDLAQLTIKPLDRKARVAPLLLFSEARGTLEKDYVISRLAPDTFELTSREKSGLFDVLRIRFADGQPTALQIVDSLQQTTEVTFGSLVINPVLAPSLFVFEPPAGVEILDER